MSSYIKEVYKKIDKYSYDEWICNYIKENFIDSEQDISETLDSYYGSEIFFKEELNAYFREKYNLTNIDDIYEFVYFDLLDNLNCRNNSSNQICI